jgi:hypothetical protein
MKLKLPLKSPSAAAQEERRVNKPLLFFKKSKPAVPEGRCNTCMKWYDRALPVALKDKELRFCTHNSCWTPPDARCGQYSPVSKDKTVYKKSQS